MRKLLSLCLALCMAFTLASPALAEGALAEAPLDGAAAEPAAAPLDAPKLAAGTIYFDGAKGNDTNNGLTSDAPVKTIGKAMELAGAGGTVKLLSTVAVGAGQTILVKDVTVIREDGFQDTMFSVTAGGTLTLENATVDGNGEAGYEAIYVGGGTLNLHEGAAVQNNVSEFGSAVYAAGGVVNMAGGVIQDNAATADGGFGGLFVENAVLNMTGGAITGNKAVNSIGAGVLLLSGAKATVTGGEIAENFAQFPNDGGLLEIEQAIAVLGQDALTLNGDARISGRVFLESGFKILVEPGFAPSQPIAIEAARIPSVRRPLSTQRAWPPRRRISLGRPCPAGC